MRIMPIKLQDAFRSNDHSMAPCSPIYRTHGTREQRVEGSTASLTITQWLLEEFVKFLSPGFEGLEIQRSSIPEEETLPPVDTARVPNAQNL